LTQFYNVKWERKKLIEMNGESCNLEQFKISQNKMPGDSKVTLSLGFSSKNLLE